MVALSGMMTCAPHEVAAVLQALPRHLRLSRAEAGCLAFEVTQSPHDPCRFLVSERFTDRAAFEAHQQRTRNSAWWRVTGHMARDFRVSDA
ncbi:putative quinol monooxygenase [Pukyongiella litopenaei]|uniref:Antibiotic biosynthesis monooxygenase n=1 Tax=Pukyongiella litopenaei TaxID=2605946 RepID=A0A2S0MTK5_9RHOB|nr:putative quinol monooxygenase [Pukyongiella litopenaei]AVO39202.1 antibiotic biosynthesis monooxygenase [Pukyongiella litopenaei]